MIWKIETQTLTKLYDLYTINLPIEDLNKNAQLTRLNHTWLIDWLFNGTSTQKGQYLNCRHVLA